MYERVRCHDEAANHQLPIAAVFWIMQIVSMEECSSLMQNLMQVHCSTCSVIFNATATQYTCSLSGIYHPHWPVQWSHHCLHMSIPVHPPWLPGYIDVVQTILVMLTTVGLFPDRSPMSNASVVDYAWEFLVPVEWESFILPCMDKQGPWKILWKLELDFLSLTSLRSKNWPSNNVNPQAISKFPMMEKGLRNAGNFALSESVSIKHALDPECTKAGSFTLFKIEEFFCSFSLSFLHHQIFSSSTSQKSISKWEEEQKYC